MIPVHQRVFERGRGDCMAACLASILELPLDAVPNPNTDAEGDPHYAVEKFLRPLGLVAVKVHRPLEPTAHGLPLDYYNARGLYCVASVPSQRWPGVRHAVVAQVQRPAGGGYQVVIVHDPNPHNRPYPPDVEMLTLTFLCSLRLAVRDEDDDEYEPPPAPGAWCPREGEAVTYVSRGRHRHRYAAVVWQAGHPGVVVVKFRDHRGRSVTSTALCSPGRFGGYCLPALPEHRGGWRMHDPARARPTAAAILRVVLANRVGTEWALRKAFGFSRRAAARWLWSRACPWRRHAGARLKPALVAAVDGRGWYVTAAGLAVVDAAPP